MIDALRSLRGVFAIFIFLHHFYVNAGGESLFPAGGDCGVAFFFMLSGFVLCAGHARYIEAGRLSYRSFIVKRVARIYPLHVLCLCWAVVFAGFHAVIADVLNLFLLQSWVPVKEFYFSGNSVAWCLSDFMFFYCVFPCLAKIMCRRRLGFAITTIVVVAVYVGFLIRLVPDDMQDAIIYISPMTRLVDFVIGMNAWLAYSRLREIGKVASAPQILQYILKLFAIALLIVTVFLWSKVPQCYALSAIWWVCMFVLIVLYALYGSPLLCCKPLLNFGNISFSFYMVHVLCITTTEILCVKLDIYLSPYAKLAAALSLAIAVATLLYYLYEKPLNSTINTLFNSSSQSKYNEKIVSGKHD